MLPWKVIDAGPTREGTLELRQRGARDFLITIGGRVLMTSTAHQSEDTLARVTCDTLAAIKRARLLVGGLGMGLSLRAALDQLGTDARVTVVDLDERVVRWCRGPLADLNRGALTDARVTVKIADVAQVIAAADARTYHAVMLDLYEGPPRHDGRRPDRLYGSQAIENARRALHPRGVLSVWSEDDSPVFRARLEAAGFAVRRQRAGRGGRTHVVYVATAPAPAARRASKASY
jgi:spermidine synthase